ncbi:hypothetical protein [Candidatus Desulforudis audaxviator]|nr:hypothetical protein [Candidatus Desulforudis audaxviator]
MGQCPVLFGRASSTKAAVSRDNLSRVSGIGPSRLADIKAQGVACVE